MCAAGRRSPLVPPYRMRYNKSRKNAAKQRGTCNFTTQSERHIMLEKMSDFFNSRLDGYEEHQLHAIEQAETFYPMTAN